MSFIDEIKELKGLLDSGALTEAEFSAAKAKLLARPIEPTEPAAADTTTVSPACGAPTSRSPKYADNPFVPRPPSCSAGSVLGSTRCSAVESCAE